MVDDVAGSFAEVGAVAGQHVGNFVQNDVVAIDPSRRGVDQDVITCSIVKPEAGDTCRHIHLMHGERAATLLCQIAAETANIPRHRERPKLGCKLTGEASCSSDIHSVSSTAVALSQNIWVLRHYPPVTASNVLMAWPIRCTSVRCLHLS
jgi:hypothetical protein